MKTPKHADLIYDVGMHLGEDTDFYLKKGFRVVAFEADPGLASRCRERFRAAVAEGRLVIEEGAIVDPASISGSAVGGTITFYRNVQESVWGTVATEWARRNEELGTSNEVIAVPCVDFRACLERHGIPHYLKVDIEGMDLVCLKALAGFENRPDYVSVESEHVSFDRLRGEFDLLMELGYDRFQAIQQSGISTSREPNPSKEGRHVGHLFPEGSSGLFGADLPGRWKSHEQILREYRFIFFQYRLFRRGGMLDNLLGRILRRGLGIVLGKQTPGWYDTHARHASV